MNTTKKLLVLLLTSVMLLGATACGGEDRRDGDGWGSEETTTVFNKNDDVGENSSDNNKENEDAYIAVEIDAENWINLSDLEVSDKIDSTIDEIIVEYTNSNGTIDSGSEDLVSARKKVYGLAHVLSQNGLIDGAAYNEEGNTVSFFLNDGTTYVYFPMITDCYSGDEYCVLSVDTLGLLDDTVISTLSGSGSEDAAKKIYNNVAEYTSWTKCTDSEAQIPYLKEMLRNLSKDNVRALFWRGHGNMYNDKDGSVHYGLVIGDKVSKKKEEDYRQDLVEKNTMAKSGRYYAINELFLKEYMSDMNGGLFYCGSCYSGNRIIAEVIAQKGFDAYCGAQADIFTLYSDKMMGTVAEYLCQTDEHDMYYTVSEAFEMAKQKHGDADFKGVPMILGSNFNNEEFRLVPHEHQFEQEWVYDKNSHWLKCKCGEIKYEATHEYSDVWSIDGTYHWKLCETCGYEGSRAEHDTPDKICSGCGYSMGLDIGIYGNTYVVNGIGICKSDEIVIPALYKNIEVTMVRYGAFKNNSSITNVQIPSSVSTIEREAFMNCSNLSSVKLPDSITTIGTEAFSGCSSITHITIPGGLTYVYDSLFSRCTSLVSVTLSNGIDRISGGMFWGCSSLQSIVIPDSVKSIGSDAFRYCSSLPNITLPDDVTTIGARSFADCTNLKNIQLSDQLMSIDTYAFWNCTSLTTITIPSGVTRIGSGAFTDCKNLQMMYFENSDVTIGAWALSGCPNLTLVGKAGSNVEGCAKAYGIGFMQG